MDSKDEEKRIAMTLAHRAYLYGAFHVVFGGGVHEASAAQLFGENTAGALAWLAGKVAADEGLSEKSVGLSLRTMTECVAEAVACVGEHSEGDAVSKATVAMEEDFPTLFRIPVPTACCSGEARLMFGRSIIKQVSGYRPSSIFPTITFPR